MSSGRRPIEPLQAIVQFGKDVPEPAQGPALLAFEKHLRALTGLDCRVFKERMGDDSKLRIMMTQAQRDAL